MKIVRLYLGHGESKPCAQLGVRIKRDLNYMHFDSNVLGSSTTLFSRSWNPEVCTMIEAKNYVKSSHSQLEPMDLMIY